MECGKWFGRPTGGTNPRALDSALFLYVGSPQSKEGDDRMEAKIDTLLRKIDPKGAEDEIRALDAAYAGRHTARQHGHGRRR